MTTQKTPEINLTKKTIDALENPAQGRIRIKDKGTKYLWLYMTPNLRSFYYYRKLNGTPVEIKIGTYPDTTPDQARAKVAEVNARYTFGQDVAGDKARGRMHWSDLFERYMDEHVRKALNPQTAREYADKNKLHLASWKNLPIAAIDQDACASMHRQAARSRHRKEGGKPIGGKRTADMTLNLVRDVFNWARVRGLVKVDNPTTGITRHLNPSRQARHRILTPDEMARFIKALNEFDDQDMADYFRLALFTGQRRKKVLSMRWADLDMTGGYWTYDKTKNDELMRLALPDAAMNVLRSRYRDANSEYVFPSRRRDAKKPYLSEPRYAFRRILEKAGINGMVIHDLRRTFGTYMAASGASEYQLMRALGHKDPQSTKVYIRLGDDMVKEPVARGVERMLNAAEK